MAKRDIDPKQVFIGKKIKSMRRLYEMKLEELAARTGLTASHISKLERGVSLPSISALMKLSRVFNLPVAVFLEDGNAAGTKYRRKGERTIISSKNGKVHVELLNDVLNGNPRTEVTMVTMSGGAGFHEKHLHGGEEVIYAIRGTTEIEVGTENYVLKEGDSIDYSGTIPHLLRNAGNGESVVLSCVTPPNPRVNLD